MVGSLSLSQCDAVRKAVGRGDEAECLQPHLPWSPRHLCLCSIRVYVPAFSRIIHHAGYLSNLALTMPVLLRRRLYCHYCGKKSTQTNLRKFQCEHCLAVNFLDEHGEITDPPAGATGASTRYASPQPMATSSIFCNTCLKNQDMLARLVAEYVPEEDDPGYHAAIAGLPAYRERLEQDYPQCCADCEPRAQAQLQNATKAAKSDNMLRNLQKTRMKRARQSFDWRLFVISGAGMGYAFSIGVQLLWHLLGAQGGARPIYRNPLQCLASWPAPLECHDETLSVLPLAIAIGFACSWWNPQWPRKLEAREGRLVGLGRYYAIQGVTLACRMAAWTLLTDLPLDARLRTMIHAITLIALVILTSAGLFSVTLDTSPRINWDYEPPRLVSETQFVPPPVHDEPIFPINNLAPPSQDNLPPWRPPTPPGDNEDAMDWTPSHSFQPRQPKPKNTAPSPFYGKLPTLSGGLRKQEPKQSIGLPPGFFDRRDPLPKTRAPETGLAEPKFFPKSIDTGLENMFGQVFSLQNDGMPPSSPVRKTRRHDASATARPSHAYEAVESSSSASAVPLFSAAVLLLLLALWMVAEHLLIAIPALRLYLLSCAALAPAVRVLKPSVLPSIAFLGETVAMLTLAAVVHSSDNDALVKIGAGALAFLVAQELFLFSQGHRESPMPVNVSLQQERADIPSPKPPVYTPELPSSTASGFVFNRQGSAESMTSIHSNSTTSTAPDWKTPRAPRSYSARRESNFGMGGLRL